MKKEDILDAINLGAAKKQGDLWYNIGRFLYVPFAVILCLYALINQVAL
jgi:NSS family neurotransmitter:Na+ symporter